MATCPLTMPCACPLTHPHKTDKWEKKPEAPSIVNIHHSDGMGLTVKRSKYSQTRKLASGEEGKRLEVSNSRGLETPYSSNTHLLETHAQLASVTEGDSTRLVLVRIRQTRHRIHLLLWKNTTSVSGELGS